MNLQEILAKHVKWLNRVEGGELADLQHANLQHANLQNTQFTLKQLAMFKIYPQGEFTLFKKCYKHCLVTLKVTAMAFRSNSPTGRKIRVSSAFVENIVDENGNKINSCNSMHDSNFIYEVGKVVKVNNFCHDFWKECAAGIHGFLTIEEAKEFYT